MVDNIEYDYLIHELGVHINLEEFKNVVYEIRASLVGTQTTPTSFGTTQLEKHCFFVVRIPTDDLENFIEFENLTKEQVVSWIEQFSDETTKQSRKKTIIEEFYPLKKYLKPTFA